jgi:hypothetical protein
MQGPKWLAGFSMCGSCLIDDRKTPVLRTVTVTEGLDSTLFMAICLSKTAALHSVFFISLFPLPSVGLKGKEEEK